MQIGIIISESLKERHNILISEVCNLLHNSACEAEIFWLRENDRKHVALIYEEVRKADFKLIITVDLAGFEQSTLTDGVSYNLLNSKQIHMLFHDCLKNEQYLSKNLSIAMFFYVYGEEYCEYLKNTYPDLPSLRKIEEWQTGDEEYSANRNASVLSDIIKDVIEECGLC